MMIDIGFTHMRATAILVFVNLLFILIVLKFQTVGNLYLLIIILTLALLFTSVLYLTLNKKKKETTQLLENSKK